MEKNVKYLPKATERLNKAYEAFELQQKRANASKEELAAVQKSIDDLKSVIGRLSYDDQEKKIGELDKLIAKESTLKMRVELLSGGNSEILANLDEAGKQWDVEKAIVNAATAELYENFKVIEAQKEKERHENTLKIQQVEAINHQFIAGINKLLNALGWNRKQIDEYKGKYHI